MVPRFNKVDIPVEVEHIGIDTFLIPSHTIAQSGYKYLCPVYELLEDGKEHLPHQNVGEFITKESLKSVASLEEVDGRCQAALSAFPALRMTSPSKKLAK